MGERSKSRTGKISKRSGTRKIDFIFIFLMIILIGAVLFFLTAFVPVKHTVRKELDGFVWEDGPDGSYEASQVSIEGTYYHYVIELFGHEDHFEGFFEISGTEETMRPIRAYMNIRDLNFTDLQGQKVNTKLRDGSITYTTGSNSVLFGSIRLTKKDIFSKILLKSKDGRYYIYPAANREEAEELKSIMEIIKL